MSHSSQPPSPYDRQYNFTDFQTANPTTPLPGQKVDQELNAVRSTLNATVSRLGEIQADDGHVRNSALNIHAIAESVEDLLTEAPVQAVNAAGASQVAAVNAAGTTQVSAVNAAAASGVASLNAVLTSGNATTAVNAAAAAQASADAALVSKNNAQASADFAQDSYELAFDARVDAINARDTAVSSASAAASYASTANNQANIAINEAAAANQAQQDAEASKMAALAAKSGAEAARDQAQAIVTNGSAQIAANVQPYLDAAAASASSAHDSANDALASQTQAASSAVAAASSASSASSSATAASGSASSAAASATAAANSAASINPAAYAPAVHTHAVGDITGLAGALVGYAPINSPSFTGSPTTPTPSGSSNNTSIVNSSWVNTKLNDYPNYSATYGIANQVVGGLPANSLAQVHVDAVMNASYTDYGQNATATVTLASGNLVFSDTNASADGKQLIFADDSSFNIINNGTSWYVGLPTSNGGSGGFYVEDLVSHLSTLGFSLTATWSGPTVTESLDQIPNLFSSNPCYLQKPEVGITTGSELMLRGFLGSYMREWGAFFGAQDNSVPVYSTGGNFVSWGKPWQSEGYLTSSSLNNYARLTTQNSFSTRQVFAASTTGAASIRISHGVAPTTPGDGDVWTTTGGLFLRQNGVTVQFADMSSTQTIGGTKTFSGTFIASGATVSLGTSTAASTINVGTGANGASITKNINIGTGGQTNSTTNITIGPGSGVVSVGANGTWLFNGPVRTTASTASGANFRIPPGTAPTAPSDGDIWSTTAGLFYRMSGTNASIPALQLANTFAAGSRNTFSSSGSHAGLNIGPVSGADPSPLVSGDVWHNNQGGVQQIIGFSNSMRGAMTAVRAYSQISVTTGTPTQLANYNVSSITDNAVGDFTLNFTAALVDTNFGVVGSTSGNAGNNGSVVVTARLAGSVRVNTIWNGVLSDVANFTVLVIR